MSKRLVSILVDGADPYDRPWTSTAMNWHRSEYSNPADNYTA